MSRLVKWGDLELPIRPNTIIPEPAEPRSLLIYSGGGGLGNAVFGGWFLG